MRLLRRTLIYDIIVRFNNQNNHENIKVQSI